MLQDYKTFKEYKEFVELLKEGLIKTHPVQIAINHIDSILMFSGLDVKYKTIKISYLVFEVQLLYNENIKDCFLENMIGLIKNLNGYFVSSVCVVYNDKKRKLIRVKELTDAFLKNNVYLIVLRFEAKYEDGAYTNNIICPDKLYHITNGNIERIKKIGLYSKSCNKLSDHPERIYLCVNSNDCMRLLKMFKNYDTQNNKEIKPYYLLEINSSVSKFVLHTDPNFKEGFFTYDNIRPNDIKVIGENL